MKLGSRQVGGRAVRPEHAEGAVRSGDRPDIKARVLGWVPDNSHKVVSQPKIIVHRGRTVEGTASRSTGSGPTASCGEPTSASVGGRVGSGAYRTGDRRR